ncbi:MAG: DUF4867 family protein [Spirochaetaceae bacterium]|nr:DUF4867 family protein [Spirochaetaceae bacterium]MDT8297712.1 DUF4867 family protein [Spirochaetaceae bacterium]
MLKRLKDQHPDLTVLSPRDKSFELFGRYLTDEAWSDFAGRTRKLIRSDDVPSYLPSCPELENGGVTENMLTGIFDDEDVQVGVCRGFNDRLNGMEWHDCPEVVVACSTLVLILGRVEDIRNKQWPTHRAVLCLLKEGDAVVLHKDTLHFAPCHVGEDPFLSVILLPRGVNADLLPTGGADPQLWKERKWLMTHADSPQRKAGAPPGIIGKNIHVEPII